MNKLTKYVCLLMATAGFVACSESKKAVASYGIIPLPQQVTLESNQPFLLKKSTVISYAAGDDVMERNAQWLAGYIQEATGYAPRISTTPEVHGIQLSLDPSIAQEEGYRLVISE